MKLIQNFYFKVNKESEVFEQYFCIKKSNCYWNVEYKYGKYYIICTTELAKHISSKNEKIFSYLNDALNLCERFFKKMVVIYNYEEQSENDKITIECQRDHNFRKFIVKFTNLESGEIKEDMYTFQDCSSYTTIL